MPPQEEPFSQLYLRFTDPVQYDYETIRPVVLFAQPVIERSQETEVPRTTIREKAKRFIQEGMVGLADKRATATKKRAVGFPEAVARHILYLKHLYPPIHYREIVRIIAHRFGHKTNHGKVKRFLDRHPIDVQLELSLVHFHDFEDAYEARWTVVRMYHEGWNKKSIAGVLKLSRQHVAALIEAFDVDDFAGLEDKRTRPAHHPHNQMTLPFLEDVFQTQLEYPDAGRFRVHGLMEQAWGDDLPSERTVGRAMAHNRFWRGAPAPTQQKSPSDPDPVPLPYQPRYCHQYWFVDIRYLIRLDGKWVYSICVIEGYSRTILAGMASRYQDTLAILQLLHAAFADYGLPGGIVSDNGSVFQADAFLDVLDAFSIQPCPIESRQSWQNLIEAQFDIQRRLADAKFKQAETLAQVQEAHALFIDVVNTTRHWAHRERTDDRLTPIAVLAGRQGRPVSLDRLRQVFRQLQFSRVINRHGYVSVQRFYIYAERGLSRRRVAIWFYQDRLHIAYQQTLLAQYQYRLQRGKNRITAISQPKLYRTHLTSPQLELLELDEEQWLKIRQRPEYRRRKQQIQENVTQLALNFKLILWLFFPL